MRKLALFCSIIGTSLGFGGCTSGPSTGAYKGTVMSCFDGSRTGSLTCVATPQGPEKEARDVDDDAQDDAFECADRDTDDDGTPDFEDEHDDSASVDDDHDEGPENDEHGTANDHDDDGIGDADDCGTTQPRV